MKGGEDEDEDEDDPRGKSTRKSELGRPLDHGVKGSSLPRNTTARRRRRRRRRIIIGNGVICCWVAKGRLAPHTSYYFDVAIFRSTKPRHRRVSLSGLIMLSLNSSASFQAFNFLSSSSSLGKVLTRSIPRQYLAATFSFISRAVNSPTPHGDPMPGPLVILHD